MAKTTTTRLSERVRADDECAPWVLDEIRKLEKAIDRLDKQNTALRAEMLMPEVFLRLTEWLSSSPQKSASGAFTAGIERQIAYALEMDVLPEIKRLQHQLATRATVEELERFKTGHDRYEKLRRLNVPQFQALYQKNLSGGKSFDSLVDELSL